MKTIVYIDGLNLYYGALKDTPHRWLDLKLLSQNWLRKTKYKQCDIVAVKYFTSLAIARPPIVQNQQSRKEQCSDLHNRLTQKRYLAALEAHIAELEIIYGIHVQRKDSFYPVEGGKRVEVFKNEEKETDVNLACSLLNDAYRNCYDCAAVMTNDTDIAPALALIKKHHPHKKVIILNPYISEKRSTAQKLTENCTSYAKIRKSVLAQSQLPDPIPNTNLHKPKEWG